MEVATRELPEEMLIEIFEYLDARSVKEAALVCKEWNRVIGIAPTIMKKFILRVQREVFFFSVYPELFPDDDFTQLMSLQRHYTSAEFYISASEERELMEVFERFGGRIADFSLSYWDWNAQIFEKMLGYMPELEKLAIDLKQRQDDDIPAGSLTLKKLKTLAVEGDWDVFSKIKAPMLMDLAIKEPEDPKTRLSPKIIEGFLKASPKLESLWVYDIGLFSEIDPELPFQLKKLVSDKYCFFKMNDNMKKFLLSQAATVEILDTLCKDPVFLEIVLTQFKRLKSLKADSSVLVASQEFYNNLKPLPFLKELKCGGFKTDIAMRAVIGNCPELVKLDLDHYGITDQLNFLAENNKSLKSLTIPSITKQRLSTKFSNLKSLTLFRVDNVEDIAAFLKANLTVDTLGIQWLSESCADLEKLDDLIVKTNLKHVKIEGAKRLLEEVYCMMTSSFGTRKAVKLDYVSRSLKIDISRKTRKTNGTKRKRTL